MVWEPGWLRSWLAALPAPAGKAQAPQARGVHGLRHPVEYTTVADGVIEPSKRFFKKQQMLWSKPGAHVLLQTRVKTLDGELGAVFKRWYPGMDIEVEEIPAAA